MTEVVTEKAVKSGIDVDMSSALKVAWALQRHGCALSWRVLWLEANDQIRVHIMSAWIREPPAPRFT